jgi:hypothetical protein
LVQNAASIAARWAPGSPGPGKPALMSISDMNRRLLKDLQFNVVAEAVARYRDPNTPHASKDYCLGLIADRTLPKLKAVEVHGSLTDVKAVMIEIVSGVPAMDLARIIDSDINELDIIPQPLVDDTT